MLTINGHRVRGARRAAEVVREAQTKLTVVASDASRPPGAVYAAIAVPGEKEPYGARALQRQRKYEREENRQRGGRKVRAATSAMGMTFGMKHGLVRIVDVEALSPAVEVASSMRAGDCVLAINGVAVGNVSRAIKTIDGAIEAAASEARRQRRSGEDDNGNGAGGDTNQGTITAAVLPFLFYNMRQLRVSLVDKIISDDSWRKDWDSDKRKCALWAKGKDEDAPELALRFDDDDVCQLTAARSGDEVRDHPLHSVVKTLNLGTITVLNAIREGVEMAASSSSSAAASSKSVSDRSKVTTSSGRDNNGQQSGGGSTFRSVGTDKGLVGNLSKLAEMYKDRLISKDDFEAFKSKLLTNGESDIYAID